MAKRSLIFQERTSGRTLGPAASHAWLGVWAVPVSNLIILINVQRALSEKRGIDRKGWQTYWQNNLDIIVLVVR